MELYERAYGEDPDADESPYQKGNGRQHDEEAMTALGREKRRWYESERVSQRDFFRMATILLLIILCIFLFFERSHSMKYLSCADWDPIMDLKGSSTGAFIKGGA
jgi:hypothetical protein